jgi:hypothetical protein
VSERRVRWTGRTRFAEWAEALGIATDEVMAVMESPDRDKVIVLYTRGTDEAEPVRRAALARDPEGVLHVLLDQPTGQTIATFFGPEGGPPA